MAAAWKKDYRKAQILAVEWLKQGFSYEEIARKLTKKKLRRLTGASWKKSNVRTLLEKTYRSERFVSFARALAALRHIPEDWPRRHTVGDTYAYHTLFRIPNKLFVEADINTFYEVSIPDHITEIDLEALVDEATIDQPLWQLILREHRIYLEDA